MLILFFYALILGVLHPKTKEVSRCTSPDGKVDAVLTYTTGGAVGPHYYSLYIASSRKRWNSFLTGNNGTLSLTCDDGKLKDMAWAWDECLTIKYESESGILKYYKKNIDCRGNHIEIRVIKARRPQYSDMSPARELQCPATVRQASPYPVNNHKWRKDSLPAWGNQILVSLIN